MDNDKVGSFFGTLLRTKQNFMYRLNVEFNI